jgi:drug/metabolite transporter (DMT)-like permease
MNKYIYIVYAILAAFCYGISIPLSKILLSELSPVFVAGLLYLGAGLGMLIFKVSKNKVIQEREASLSRKDLPYTITMIALDVLAPIFLLIGILKTTSSTASLLNNFEIVATSVIAFCIFKEAVGKRTWIAIILVTIASVILSIDDFQALQFSIGAIFVLLACVCWGFENNCTARLSLKNPLEIVIIKGIGSGVISLIIALLLSQLSFNILYISVALILGFFAIGLSVYFYILAQRHLGASRTSAYYALAPFIGAGLSFLILKETISASYIIALSIMIVGVYLTTFEKHDHLHTHEPVTHNHRHNHKDNHHDHLHFPEISGEHSHEHTHHLVKHKHPHTADFHPRHEH